MLSTQERVHLLTINIITICTTPISKLKDTLGEWKRSCYISIHAENENLQGGIWEIEDRNSDSGIDIIFYGSTHTLSRWHNVRKSIEDETEETWFVDSIELTPSEKGFWHRTATIVELGEGFPRKRNFLEAQWSEASVDRWWKGRFSGGTIRVAGLITAIDGSRMLFSVFLLLLLVDLFWVGSGFSYPCTLWRQQPREPGPIIFTSLNFLDNPQG